MLAGISCRNSVRLSVRPSVHLSVTRLLCGWWATPLPSEMCAQSDLPPFGTRRLRQISAYNVSTVRYSEKVQL